MKTTSAVAILILGWWAGPASAELTLEQVAKNPDLWPSRVTVNKALTVQLVNKDLDPQGFEDVPEGTDLLLERVSGSTLDVQVGRSYAIVFAADTDLLARAAYIQKHGREKPQPKPGQTEAAPVATAPTSVLGRRLAGQLVRNVGGRVTYVPETETKDAEYFVFYHSAAWCGPCRAFTPQLVSLYNSRVKNNPKVEFIFISADRSSAAMDNYITSYRMPWPAISYSARSNFIQETRKCGRGIPGLAVYDRDGRVVASGNRANVMQKIQDLL
ncbi:MAG: thioredoxin-like domain-containing protein [Verrucomicrobiota bacterium]